MVIGPWTSPEPVRGLAGGVQRGDPTATYGFLVVFLLVLGSTAAFFARQNLRLGRGDRRGATRVMLFTLASWGISWLAIEHHVAGVGELLLIGAFVGLFVPIVGVLWLFYIAVEPFARRRWPGMLVSWNRALTGDFRDPLVGRDVAIGVAAGVAFVLILQGGMILQSASGGPMPIPQQLDWNMFNGARSWVGSLLGFTSSAVAGGLSQLLTLLLFRLLLRRDWAASLALVVFFVATNPGDLHWAVLVTGLAASIFSVFILVRVGLLANVVRLLVINLLFACSLTANPSAWYSGIGYGVVLVCGVITLYGLRTGLGGRPVMSTVGIDD
jgi:serine/threonine-protein kinase